MNMNRDRAKEKFCQLSTDQMQGVLLCPSINGTMVEDLITPDSHCNYSLNWGADDSESIFITAGIKGKLDCDLTCQSLREEAEKKLEQAKAAMEEYYGGKESFFSDSATKIKGISEAFLSLWKNTQPGDTAQELQSKMDRIFYVNFGEDWETGPFKDEIMKIKNPFDEATVTFDPTGTDFDVIKANTEKQIERQSKVEIIVLSKYLLLDLCTT